jgi:hypothetical protein
VDAPDPLAHVPDPNDRYQVFGYVDKDHMPWIEIADAETRAGLTIDLLSALKVAGDISRQAVYVMEQMMARHLAEDDSQSLGESAEERWYRSLWGHGTSHDPPSPTPDEG